jgi:hypothetical protein
MTTEHTAVRSGKSERKPFNSNVADYLLIIATFGFSTLAYRSIRQASQLSRLSRRSEAHNTRAASSKPDVNPTPAVDGVLRGRKDYRVAGAPRATKETL